MQIDNLWFKKGEKRIQVFYLNNKRKILDVTIMPSIFLATPLFPRNARAHPALSFNGTCHYKAARGGGEGGLSLS